MYRSIKQKANIMATRSTIAIKQNDGEYKQIYCHWDGYLSNNGLILLKNYDTPEKVRQLIWLGSLSSLSNTIESCVPHYKDGSDRKDFEIKVFKDEEDFEKHKMEEEFDYLFDESTKTWSYDEGKGKYKKITLAMCK